MATLKKTWGVLLGTGLSGTAVAVDFTIVNTSLANIEHDLHTSVSQLQWIMAGFGILFSALIVAMGRLGDLRGHRKVLYFGMIGFALASLGAGLSQSPMVLIVMRILQGAFGSTIFPNGLAIVAHSFPKNQQGRALSLYNGLIGTGLALGPVLGSLIVTLLGWRWIFFINLPIILISFAICFPIVNESTQRSVEPIDWPGAIALIILLLTFVFAISQGSLYGWHSTIIISCFVISFVSLITFILIEQYTDSPLIPIHLFLNRGFLTGQLVFWSAVGMAWSVIFIMPLYLHTSLGYTTSKVGLVLFVMTIMTMIMPPIAGYYYDRKGPTAIIHIMFLLILLTLFMFTKLQSHGPLGLILISFFIYGITWGIGNGIATPLGLSNLSDIQNSGLITGALITLLNVFAVVVLAADTALFDFGKKISFVHGVHMASALLFILVFILWLGTAVVLHSKGTNKTLPNP